MIFVFLLQVFAAVTLILFTCKLIIAQWPDSAVARALTFTYA